MRFICSLEKRFSLRLPHRHEPHIETFLDPASCFGGGGGFASRGSRPSLGCRAANARRRGLDGQASAWDWDLPKIPAQAILDALQHAFLTNNDAELGGHQWRRKEFTCDQNPI